MSVISAKAKRMIPFMAIAAMTMLWAPASWADRCKTEGGPVNHGQVFYGVKCNYAACYCTIRRCLMVPPRVTCQRLQMKF
jgi:hypothetical protein